jgi:lipopolysaccharide export system permease protein
MLGLVELKYTVDSLSKDYNKEIISVSDNIYQRFTSNIYNNVDSLKIKKNKTASLTSFLSIKEKARIYDFASSDAMSTKQNLEISNLALALKKKDINNFWIAINEKFVVALACLLMFFIGAPLGAVIRKGGLGLPIVFAMLIFITFHFLNTFGKKVAQESAIPAFVGAWISFFLLVPLAIYLTRKALNDNGNLSFEIEGTLLHKFYLWIISLKKSHK